MNNKNLKQVGWQKGKSGNPNGRPRMPEDMRNIASLTTMEVVKLISKMARMTLAELNSSIKDPTSTVIDISIANIFLQCIDKGDFTRLSFLLDRAIGKAPVAIDTDDDRNERAKLTKMSMNELLTLVKNVVPETDTETLDSLKTLEETTEPEGTKDELSSTTQN